MPNHFLTPVINNKKTATLAQLATIAQFPFAPVREGLRRTEHGSSAWLPPDSGSQHEPSPQRQPQDGITRSLAADMRTIQARVTARIAAAKTATTANSQFFSKLLSEPEDARLTGGTRSLMRRVLGLNVPKLPRKAETLRPVRVA